MAERIALLQCSKFSKKDNKYVLEAISLNIDYHRGSHANISVLFENDHQLYIGSFK